MPIGTVPPEEKAGIAEPLARAMEQLDGAEKELTVDLSAIRRLRAADLRALEDLARAAEQQTVKLTLRGAGPEVYKTLKVAKAAQKFSFAN